MQITLQVMAHEREKTRNRERLITIAQDFPVERVFVVYVGDEGDTRVDGYHEEDADDVFLLVGTRVVGRVEEHEGKGYNGGDEGEDCGHGEADVVEGHIAEDGDFGQY